MAKKKDYYESEAKRKWQRENTTFIGLKLQNGDTDADIRKFLQAEKAKGNGYQTVIKAALRDYMAHHPQD